MYRAHVYRDKIYFFCKDLSDHRKRQLLRLYFFLILFFSIKMCVFFVVDEQNSSFSSSLSFAVDLEASLGLLELSPFASLHVGFREEQ